MEIKKMEIKKIPEFNEFKLSYTIKDFEVYTFSGSNKYVQGFMYFGNF
jgi:hypothetical protein